MYIGEYGHSIDTKGRVIMPAKFREQLGEKFIVTKGIDRCLFVYSTEEWNLFADKLRSLPTTDQKSQSFLRMLFAGACECEVDKQGRILLPNNLREHAQLEKEVSIIGVHSRVEIWSQAHWTQYNADASAHYDEVLDKMAQLGI